jgi:autotransporter-associated beta strand protein
MTAPMSRRPPFLPTAPAAITWAVAAALAAPPALFPAGASGAAVTPVQSDRIVDSVGINVHAMYNWGPYSHWDWTVDTIGLIGFRSARDCPNAWERLNQLTDATGAAICVIMQDGATRPDAINMSFLPSVMENTRRLHGVDLLEGPNERDQMEGDWLTPLSDWQIAMYQQAKADPLLADKPVLSPTMWTPYMQFATHLRPYFDAGNFHHYSPHAGPTLWYLADRLRDTREFAGPDKPVYITETGFHNGINHGDVNWPGVSERTAARYLPAGVMELYRQGIARSYIYELAEDLNDPTGTQREVFGLIREDRTWKPAAYAMKNLIDLLRDPGGDFTTTPLDYTVSGGPSDLVHLLLQKRDGSYYLALWRNFTWLYDPNTKTDIDPAAQDVTVTLGSAVDGAQLFLPTTSVLPAGQLDGSISQFNVSLGGDLVLMRLGGGAVQPLAASGGFLGIWQDVVTNQSLGGGAYGVTKTGPARLTLNAASTYTGDTTVREGTLAVGHPSALGSATTPIVVGDSSGIQDAALLLSASITFSRDVVLLAGSTGAATLGTAAGAGTATFAGLITLQKDAVFSAAGGTTLVLGGAISEVIGGQPRGITKSGAGTAIIAGATNFTGTTNVAGGTLALTSSLTGSSGVTVADGATLKLQPGGGKLLRAPTLSVATTPTGGGRIDLADNKLVTAADLGSWDGSSYTGVIGLVQRGRNGGSWDGAGINSSSAATAGRLTALAVATAGSVGKANTNFGGVLVSAGDVLVMYTYAGDADLNGKLDGDDYFRIDSNINVAGAHGWVNGDFDYSGKINGDDYFILDSNLGRQGAAFSTSASGGIAPVPEPASGLTGLAISAMALCRRRRRPPAD